MRKLIFVAIFILLVFAAFLLSFEYHFRSETKLKTLNINGKEIQVELADTVTKQTLGLSGRNSLPENQGMLFLFSQPAYYSFWMKDMKFALDIVWIANGQIVEISQNVQPQDYQPPNSITPEEKVNIVLEINAGQAQKLDIKVGDKIIF
jgi:hypothetical protein